MVRSVDYDSVAADYSTRYDRNDYSGVADAVTAFLSDARASVLEVGCGTGHWLDLARHTARPVVGVDLAARMLDVAHATARDAHLIRARAEALPFAAHCFDRVFCINALHHFTDPGLFVREAFRVIRPGGAVLSIGLDPHTGQDRWWIYEYFPEARVADCQRYLPTGRLREIMAASGFQRCETRLIQHRPATLRLIDAERRGFLARTSTSQLMVIGDAEYQAGLARIHAGAVRIAPDDLVLRSDLRLYATTGWSPE
jgi:ubiquinone/menaquinone biosynthesis C-methylase UbiE